MGQGIYTPRGQRPRRIFAASSLDGNREAKSIKQIMFRNLNGSDRVCIDHTPEATLMKAFSKISDEEEGFFANV